jgi:hypothetical protein
MGPTVFHCSLTPEISSSNFSSTCKYNSVLYSGTILGTTFYNKESTPFPSSTCESNGSPWWLWSPCHVLKVCFGIVLKYPKVCASNDTVGRVWIGLARLHEVFASSGNAIALAIRQTAWTKLCADLIPSQIARRMPVPVRFILQFWGPSDGLWPPTQNFATVPRPGILDTRLKPISHSFCNCKIFTANEYFTYPYKHHGGNQRLTGNADPSPEERFNPVALQPYRALADRAAAAGQRS